MYTEILFPTDGSEGASVTFDHVLEIAAAHDSTVHILHVADTMKDSVVRMQGDVVDVLEQEGAQIVRDATDRARERGVDTVTEVRQGTPYSTIIDYAESRNVDLITMPTHGRRGLKRFLLGSTTERVVRRADTPVLTFKPNGESVTYPYRDVLVPTDGSDCAREALTVGVEIADTEDAALHLLSVITTSSLGVDVRSDIQLPSLEESAKTILEGASSFAEDAGVDPVSETVESGGSIHQAICAYIEAHDIDLVVVGTHGRTGFDRYLLGSVTEHLIRTSPIPVLTVRESPSEA
ncbi:universal stress protein [Natrinema salaciae]|uniref:Nucleotide-binding universal stress protein, UspA family n=1 Tax=Natrinema salaciae TaxID=1186196 RepID=A0A1H9CGY5_9EURY|nr:universal stress protein [Natrinema salaciae]SEQ00311.1 Nucleotide-binding universal stress protein, UspA family [Natrinema salaciae]